MADLVALAADYVRVAGQLREIREQMRMALMNGDASAGPTPQRPKRGAPPGPRTELMARAAQADQRILDLLKAQPGTTRSQIIAVTGGAMSTLANRLTRLERQGLVQRTGGAWSATLIPTS
jgi:hypothetical protein